MSDGSDPQLMDRWTRRKFLQATGAAAAILAAGPALAACGGGPSPASSPSGTPVARRGAKIRLLQWNSFVKSADTEIKRQADEWGKSNGVDVSIETISGDQLQTKTVAAVEAGDGPDIIQMQYAWPYLYEKSCLDVGNEVKQLTSTLGALDPVADTYTRVKGTYRAIPYCMVPNAWVYRTDIFQQAGITQFPKSWEELADAGRKLKEKNLRPIAQTIGHAYGDATTMWYPVLWSFGGKEVQEDGKTVAINSKGTEAALKWAIDAWNSEYLSKNTLSWLDPDNNQAYHAGEISATLNGASIYIKELWGPSGTGADANKKYDKVSDHAAQPKGPLGTFTLNLSLNHAIMKWSREPDTAKAFLLWLMQPAQFSSKWMAASRGYNAGVFKTFDNDPVWASDKKLPPFEAVVKTGKWPGWPAKPSRETSKVQTQFIITDMFARAVTSRDARAAILDAEQKLKQIYERPA